MNRSNKRSRYASDNGHRTSNVDNRYASDYYYNANQPVWTERDEAWYRHTYGLPASGRMGQRRHDIAEWGNPSFTQNTTNREYRRMNDEHSDFEIERDEKSMASEVAHHRGKGPKGFTRSDERIKDDIHVRLTDDAYVDASEIEVTVANSEVVLTGTVPDRSSKRRAEDIVELVSGVKNVENRLRVK